MNILVTLLKTLSLTLIIEYPIVQLLWLAMKHYKSEEKSKLILCNGKVIIIPCLIINILTNPAINIFAKYLWTKTQITENEFWIIISVLEVGIFLIEAVLYKFLLNTKWKNALILSFVSNYISYMSSFMM